LSYDNKLDSDHDII